MKLFGTDGIRGKANKYPITADAALELGKSFVTLINKKNTTKNSGNTKIAVGRDTRISGSMLEDAVIAGINAAGADAYPLGVVPSNLVSYLIGVHSCDGGIMISASHNAADENGFKFFSAEGHKISEETEQELENIFFSGKFAKAAEPGSVFRVRDVKQSCISMIADSLQGNNLAGLTLGVDPGNGSASYIVKDLFHELKADATIINNEPDGNNINQGGAMMPQQLQELVKQNKLDAGIALDGDADRLIMVDELGNAVDGDALIAIAAVNLKSKGKLGKNTIVVTNYSNTGLDTSLKDLGIQVTRVKTGDKHVSSKLFRQKLSLGGENSGHIIFTEFAKTADALLASVQILGVMKEQDKPLSELAAVVKKLPQVMLNVTMKEKKDLKELPAVTAQIREAEKTLDGKGRVFVRYSGTENKLRILVEGEKSEVIKELADSIAKSVEKNS